jgi:hypothetical protein
MSAATHPRGGTAVLDRITRLSQRPTTLVVLTKPKPANKTLEPARMRIVLVSVDTMTKSHERFLVKRH